MRGLGQDDTELPLDTSGTSETLDTITVTPGPPIALLIVMLFLAYVAVRSGKRHEMRHRRKRERLAKSQLE